MLKYLLQQKVNPNVQGLLLNAINAPSRRSDVIRLLLRYGAIYEQKFEYIDKDTKLPVSRIFRYNDPQF